MAARKLKPHHQEDVRSKIQASQLINYLQGHALKGTGSKNANTRVRAALGLLAKTLPDVATIQHTGDGGGPLQIEIVRFAPETAG